MVSTGRIRDYYSVSAITLDIWDLLSAYSIKYSVPLRKILIEENNSSLLEYRSLLPSP